MRDEKNVGSEIAPAFPEDMTAEHIQLLLQEADRALMLVEARSDAPGHRVLEGIPFEDAIAAAGMSELGMTIAELIDTDPGVQYDIESVSEVNQAFGGAAGAEALMSRDALVQLIRLSLESLFRICPNVELYESWLPDGDHECDLRPAQETYDSLVASLKMLRGSLN